jgi:hypothetical protein
MCALYTALEGALSRRMDYQFGNDLAEVAKKIKEVKSIEVSTD